MTKPLSFDLRTRVLAAVHAGASHREAAERYNVSAASVSRWRALAYAAKYRGAAGVNLSQDNSS
jgi:transposase